VAVMWSIIQGVESVGGENVYGAVGLFDAKIC
jgi:hypothetical protein